MTRKKTYFAHLQRAATGPLRADLREAQGFLGMTPTGRDGQRVFLRSVPWEEDAGRPESLLVTSLGAVDEHARH